MSFASLYTPCFVMICVFLYGPFCHGAHADYALISLSSDEFYTVLICLKDNWVAQFLLITTMKLMTIFDWFVLFYLTVIEYNSKQFIARAIASMKKKIYFWSIFISSKNHINYYLQRKC